MTLWLEGGMSYPAPSVADVPSSAASLHARQQTMEAHRRRVEAFAAALAAGAGRVRLAKRTTNLFRPRREPGCVNRLPAEQLSHVLMVEADRQRFETEPVIWYEHLVDSLLPAGLMPAVVPELKSITIGGAVAGLGIEASSFRYGLVHHTIEEMDVALADGTVVRARPDNEHADLFWCMPNSFGTLGYLVRVRAKAVPTLPFVHLRHERSHPSSELFDLLERRLANAAYDFIEAVVFGPEEAYVTTASFVPAAPYLSDYSYLQIYYKSIRSREEDYLSVRDYIWRWDTDWFWCSRLFGLENRLLRRLFGRRRLNSVTYMRILQLRRRLPDLAWLRRLLGREYEPLIHDIPIPFENARDFFRWYAEEIRMFPLWLCPIGVPAHDRTVLYPLRPGTVYVNFGFWGPRPIGNQPNRWRLNRLITQRTLTLGGLPSLYTRVFLKQDEFRRLYGGDQYEIVKSTYDPKGRLPHIIDKLDMLSEAD